MKLTLFEDACIPRSKVTVGPTLLIPRKPAMNLSHLKRECFYYARGLLALGGVISFLRGAWGKIIY